MTRVESLVSLVARALADHPDQVAVTSSERRGRTYVEVFMAPGDLGRLIGRQGRTAQAVRTLATIAGERDDLDVEVEFRDGPPPAGA